MVTWFQCGNGTILQVLSSEHFQTSNFSCFFVQNGDFPIKKIVFFLYPSRQNNQHASKTNRLKSIERTNVGHHLKPLTTLPAPPTYMRKNYHIPKICKNHPKIHRFGGFVATPLTLPTSICFDLFSSVIITPIFPELYLHSPKNTIEISMKSP